MSSSSYQQWCRLIGEEIVSSLSESDKEYLSKMDKTLNKDERNKLEIELREESLKFLEKTPPQRMKMKSFQTEPKRLHIIYLALKYLHLAHLALDISEGFLAQGPYRKEIARLGHLCDYLRKSKLDIKLSGDSF